MNDEYFDSPEEGGAYTETTSDIRVTVSPAPSFKNSDPGEDVYAFSYTITIENLGRSTVQLLERHWNIFSNEEQIAEVVGPGVVGVQPTLAPGQSFQYTSGAVIHHPRGSMRGVYTFRGEGGRRFEVVIPAFALVYPVMIH